MLNSTAAIAPFKTCSTMESRMTSTLYAKFCAHATGQSLSQQLLRSTLTCSSGTCAASVYPSPSTATAAATLSRLWMPDPARQHAYVVAAAARLRRTTACLISVPTVKYVSDTDRDTLQAPYYC